MLRNGQTALHFAVLSSDESVKLLAANGAQLDIKDKQGRTPLDFALGAGGRGRAGSNFRSGAPALPIFFVSSWLLPHGLDIALHS